MHQALRSERKATGKAATIKQVQKFDYSSDTKLKIRIKNVLLRLEAEWLKVNVPLVLDPDENEV